MTLWRRMNDTISCNHKLWWKIGMPNIGDNRFCLPEPMEDQIGIRWSCLDAMFVKQWFANGGWYIKRNVGIKAGCLKESWEECEQGKNLAHYARAHTSCEKQNCILTGLGVWKEKLYWIETQLRAIDYIQLRSTGTAASSNNLCNCRTTW